MYLMFWCLMSGIPITQRDAQSAEHWVLMMAINGLMHLSLKIRSLAHHAAHLSLTREG
jgi:hypothetical protein